jgi:sugar-specific transcriptional regulator TrmB
MNPSDLSKRLGLHRGYIYDALERMQEKDVVNVVLIDNKRKYQAADPKSLVELLRYKLENLKNVVPELEKISESRKEEAKVELHKGNNVFRTMLKDITATAERNGTIHIFGIDEEYLQGIEPIYLQQYFRKIKNLNINEKVIIRKGSKKLSLTTTTYREIGEEFIGRTFYTVYGSRVAIFIPGNPHNLIIIDNRDVADTYRKQFDLLWGIAKVRRQSGLKKYHT